MNIQVQELLEGKDQSVIDRFAKIDFSITHLYLHGYIPRSIMVKAREKLVKEITTTP